uniref:Sulfhydryl oxidase n=1 Tax=Neogobius melanostomus TaxID=47308 RepID=A0A8C6WNI2_9GOBI
MHTWCWWRLWLQSAVLLSLLPRRQCAAARLYTEQDPLVILTRDSLQATLTDSTSAWLVQFYSSWCGHCIQYSGTWKALARDVRDWQGAMGVAVFDCALEDNFDLCREYSIKFYPTFKVRALAHVCVYGVRPAGGDREIPSVRQLMVNILQNHTTEERPNQCPELRPYSSVELLPLLGQKSDHFTAVIVEEPQSFTGREVILDLLPYSGLDVRRALSSDRPLLDTLGITALPSVHLLHPNGSHYSLHTEKRLRFFFTSLLRTLPGVHRKTHTNSSVLNPQKEALSAIQDSPPWRDFDRSVVYAADLESALHYLFRVELASHSSLEGDELQTFKDLVTLLAKLYPGGGAVVKLMETLSDWLLSLPLQKIPYQAVLDLVDNKMKISGVFLGAELRWVGCQGSAPGFRGYPCALWTLFHVLAARRHAAPSSLRHTALEAEPAPVLSVMRRYIRTFFGCEECGRNFEKAASSDGAAGISTPEQEVMWLWNQHNEVNDRLAGSLSDDPLFPKGAWPPPTLCASCHEENRGLHAFNQQEVLSFLLRHYGEDNLSRRYAVQTDEGEEKGSKEVGGKEGLANDSVHKDAKQDFADKPDRPDKADRTGERGDQEEERESQSVNRTLALGFNSVDMSLCLLLYIGSCVFLMLLFFFFRVRSRRWKLRPPKLTV